MKKNVLNEDLSVLGGLIWLIGSAIVIKITNSIVKRGRSWETRDEMANLLGIDKLESKYLELDQIEFESIKKIVQNIIDDLESDYNLQSTISKIRKYNESIEKLILLFDKFKSNLPNELGVDPKDLSSKELRQEYFRKNPNTKHAREYNHYITLYPKLKKEMTNLYDTANDIVNDIIYKNTGDEFEEIILKTNPKMRKNELNAVRKKYLSLIHDRANRLIKKTVINNTDKSFLKRSFYSWIKDYDKHYAE